MSQKRSFQASHFSRAILVISMNRLLSLYYRDRLHQWAGNLDHWGRNFVPIFTLPTLFPSMLFPLLKPPKKMKTNLFFFWANCWKELGNQANGSRERMYFSQDFSLLAFLWALSLIPTVPRHSWMKSGFGSSHTLVAVHFSWGFGYG